MIVLITGATGQLGVAMSQWFAREQELVPLTRDELDLARHRAIRPRIRHLRADVVINCAAYNDVDGAGADVVTGRWSRSSFARVENIPVC